MHFQAEKLKNILRENIKQKSLLYGVLSGCKHSQNIKKITFRPIKTRNEECFQFSKQLADKVIHENISDKEAADYIVTLLTDFAQATLCTVDADFHVLFSKKEKLTIVKQKPSKKKETLSHNRQKQYLIPEGIPVDFLCKLGIMNAEGKVFAKKSDKFRQINRFLEIVDDVLCHFPVDQELRIIDFGCGKSYLSFALYHYLYDIKKYPVHLMGLDLKKEVIEFCSSLAKELNYENLTFQVGDINHFSPANKVDMVICLHACDTATDAALETAVRWKAKIILAVPCCQHELYRQIDSSQLSPLLRHGILKERFSALVTDAARAEILEMMGYKCQIMEFIDLEHTPKNLLIRAVCLTKTGSFSNKEAYMDFARALSVYPSLEKRLMPRSHDF